MGRDPPSAGETAGAVTVATSDPFHAFRCSAMPYMLPKPDSMPVITLGQSDPIKSIQESAHY
jgi:hypothetical protein